MAQDRPTSIPTSSPSGLGFSIPLPTSCPHPQTSSRSQRTAWPPSHSAPITDHPHRGRAVSGEHSSSSALPRLAGGRGQQPILLPDGSHCKPNIFCYPLPFKLHPFQFHPRIHYFSKKNLERGKISLHAGQLLSHPSGCSSSNHYALWSAQALPLRADASCL